MSECVNFDVSQEKCEELVRLHPEQAAGEIIALRALLTCAESEKTHLTQIKHKTMGLIQSLINDGDNIETLEDLYELLSKD